MTSFAYGVIVGFIAVSLYGEWRQRRQARPARIPVSERELERIYEPLYTWVLDAEIAGTISEREAADAIDALIEAEGLEWQFLAPSGTDGPRERTI